MWWLEGPHADRCTNMCVCVFVCAYWEKSAINKYMPVASNNDRAIFFRGWRRQSFWTGFRHKDKETNLDLWSAVWVGMIFVTSGSEIFQSTLDTHCKKKQTYGEIECLSHLRQKTARKTGSDTSGLVRKICFFWRSALCGKLRLTHHQQLHVLQVHI